MRALCTLPNYDKTATLFARRFDMPPLDDSLPLFPFPDICNNRDPMRCFVSLFILAEGETVFLCSYDPFPSLALQSGFLLLSLTLYSGFLWIHLFRLTPLSAFLRSGFGIPFLSPMRPFSSDNNFILFFWTWGSFLFLVCCRPAIFGPQLSSSLLFL